MKVQLTAATQLGLTQPAYAVDKAPVIANIFDDKMYEMQRVAFEL